MLFKVNQANLDHLYDTLDEYPTAWLHGDGNVYVDEEASDFKMKFSNPLHGGQLAAAAYRVKFTDQDDIPTGSKAIEKIERMMLDNAQSDAKKAAEPKEKKEFKVVKQRIKAQVDTEDTADDSNDTKASELAAKESQLLAAAKNVTARAEELAAKERELADKEARLKEIEAKMAAATKAETKTAEPAKKS